MSRRSTFICLLAVLALCGAFLAGCSRGEHAGSATQYYCPMHPEVTSDRPGDCPICNMRLEPRAPVTPHAGMAADSARVEGLAAVAISPAQRQLAGIRTVAVAREVLAPQLRTVGTVTVDETLLHHMHVKVSGYIEKLFVNTTGQYVRRGQTALEIYSPELLASQEEFLQARAAAARFATSNVPEVRRGGEDLLRAARRRLELYDVPFSFINALESRGTVQRLVPLNAHASGYVIMKAVTEGQQVGPGMEIFTLADLSRVWVEANVYENEARLVRAGQTATLESPFDPTARFEGKVTYIQPVLDPTTRTLGVRFEFPNPDLVLKPAMYVNVTLNMEPVSAIVVPDAAVLDSGLRQIVFVETAPDHYAPRQVRTGARSGGKVEILAGVEPGERVVDRANFLLDSESRLRGALEGANDKGGHAHQEQPR